jgi:hypothetical protein
MEIDFKKIDGFIEWMKKQKPPFVAVNDEEWANALDGYRESLPNGLPDQEENQFTTDTFWSLIYFSAVAFCRGMEHQAVKSGQMKESNYPKY